MGRFLRRVKHLLLWSRHDADLREEIETHRALRQAQLERDGVAAGEAHRASGRLVGHVAIAREDVHDLWLGSADAWWQDLRHGVRALASRIGFSAAAVLTLTLSIGANLVVFTVVNALWLRPRPMPDPDRVVMVSGANDLSGTSEGYYFGAKAIDQRVRNQAVFESVAGQVPTSGEMADNLPHLTLPRLNREVETLGVSFQYFTVMGLRITGRDFTGDDDRMGAEPVAIISDRFWQTAFAGSPDVIGTRIDTSPIPLRVIGVAPPGFHGARLGEQTDFWVSRFVIPQVAAPGMGQSEPSLLVLARLRKGMTTGDAERALAQASATPPGSPYFVPYRVIPVSQLYGSPVGRTILVHEERVLGIAAATAGLVLLAGCTTLMALVLVHYERRRQELAIRMALGCARIRLLRALVVELGVLVVIGAIGAFAVSSAGLRALPALSLPGGLDLGRLDMDPDWRVAGFGVLASVVTLAIAAGVPLRRSTRHSLVTDLVSSTARSTASSLRLRRAILGLHVAATMVVLIAAGLFVRTIVYGFTAGAGFDTERLLFVDAKIRPSSMRFEDSGRPQIEARNAENAERVRRVLDLLRALPNVDGVAMGRSPIGLDQAAATVRPRTLVIGSARRETRVSFEYVEPWYLEVLGVRQLAGRSLTDADVRDVAAPGGHSVVVTRSLAGALWPGGQAVGEQLAFPDARYFYQVVGVVSDLAFGSLRLNQRAGVFVPTDVQHGVRPMTIGFTVRTKSDPTLLVASVRKIIAGIFPNAPLVDIATGREIVRRDLGRERLGAWFFSGFGLVALALGVGGVFGLVAYLAESRRREMGIRLALGAMPGEIIRLIVTAGLWPVAVGTAAGLAGAALLARVVDSLLIGVGRLDPVTYVSAAVLMVGCTAVAGLVAAWRLRRVLPNDALRVE